jgi:hypothetical protein
MPTDADLISIIRTHLALIKCKLRQCWIKGHQDSSATRKLSATSRQDSVASGCRTSGHMQSRPGCEHVHSQCCSISINHQRLSGQFDECTRYHVNGYHLLRHLQDKNAGPTKCGTRYSEAATSGEGRRSNTRPHGRDLHRHCWVWCRHWYRKEWCQPVSCPLSHTAIQCNSVGHLSHV